MMMKRRHDDDGRQNDEARVKKEADTKKSARHPAVPSNCRCLTIGLITCYGSRPPWCRLSFVGGMAPARIMRLQLFLRT